MDLFSESVSPSTRMNWIFCLPSCVTATRLSWRTHTPCVAHDRQTCDRTPPFTLSTSLSVPLVESLTRSLLGDSTATSWILIPASSRKVTGKAGCCEKQPGDNPGRNKHNFKHFWTWMNLNCIQSIENIYKICGLILFNNWDIYICEINLPISLNALNNDYSLFYIK